MKKLLLISFYLLFAFCKNINALEDLLFPEARTLGVSFDHPAFECLSKYPYLKGLINSAGISLSQITEIIEVGSSETKDMYSKRITVYYGDSKSKSFYFNTKTNKFE